MIVCEYKKSGQTFSFQVCMNWKDITLERLLSFLKKIEPQMPECLKNIYDEEEEEARIKLIDKLNEDDNLAILNYQLKYIHHFSNNVSFEDIQNIKVSQVRGLYDMIRRGLANEPKNEYINVIEHVGENWYLPEKHMKNSTFIEFVESAQYEKHFRKAANGGNAWHAMPKILCILLRKKGEAFTMDVYQRERLFLKMTMDKVFNVAFFLTRLNETFGLDTLVYTKLMQVVAKRKKLEDCKKILAGTSH